LGVPAAAQILHNRLLDQDDRRVLMTDRRDAADGEAGRLAHEIGVGAVYRLANRRRRFLFIDAIDARGDDQDRPPACPAAEDQRLGDLGDVAADRRGGVGGGAGAGVELQHFEPVAQHRLNLERGGAFGGLHSGNPIGCRVSLPIISLIAVEGRRQLAILSALAPARQRTRARRRRECQPDRPP
jgi:hypothetical protein